MTEELKKSLIGKQITVVDSVFNKETKKYEDEKIIVKVLSFEADDTLALVEKTNKYSEPIIAGSDVIIEFEFPEKLILDIESNHIKDRRSSSFIFNHNNEIFRDAMEKAVKELEGKKTLYYVYRHYGPASKPTFSSTILIGVTTDKNKTFEIMGKDSAEYEKEANEVDSRPQKYAYSISDSIIYVTKKTTIVE